MDDRWRDEWQDWQAPWARAAQLVLDTSAMAALLGSCIAALIAHWPLR
jgi:hypothetical protein